MDYLWYSHKQAHCHSGDDDDDGPFAYDLRRSGDGPIKARAISFKRAASPPHRIYGDSSFYLDGKGEAHVVSSVTHDPHHHTRWDDIGLVATAGKATHLGGTRHGLNGMGLDYCAAKSIEPTIDGLIDYIYARDNCALPQEIKVGRPLKLGRKSP